MPVTMLTGLVDDNNVLSNQRKPDMDPVIAQLESDDALLATLLMRLPRKPAISQKVEWLEDELHPRYTAATASFTNVATNITVTTGTGAYFKVNDILRDELTGENMLVTAVAVDTLTVTRGIGSVTGTASSGSTDGLIRVSNASLEGASLPTMKQTKKVAQYNYTQIVRTSAGFTRTATESQWFGQEDVVGYEVGKKILEHKREIEQTALLGRRNLITSGTNPQGFAGGITDYLSTNVQGAGGTLTTATLETFLRACARYGNRQNKLALCAPVALSAMAGFPLGRLAPPDNSRVSSWGIGPIQTYYGGSGMKINVVECPPWDDFSKTSPALGGSIIVIDMGNVQMRDLHKTSLEEDRQANDSDSKQFEYLSEFSFTWKHERTHGWLRGITG